MLYLYYSFFFFLLCSEAGAGCTASQNFIYDPKPSISEKMEVTLLIIHVVMQICSLLNWVFTSKFQGNIYFVTTSTLACFLVVLVFWGFFFDSTDGTAALCPAHWIWKGSACWIHEMLMCWGWAELSISICTLGPRLHQHISAEAV